MKGRTPEIVGNSSGTSLDQSHIVATGLRHVVSPPEPGLEGRPLSNRSRLIKDDVVSPPEPGLEGGRCSGRLAVVPAKVATSAVISYTKLTALL